MARHTRLRSEPDQTGESLPQGVRHYFETQFETDLGDVRIHTDSAAASEAEQLGASAFTAGREIYFARGMYAPGSSEGRALLGHEIAHVIQQRLASEDTQEGTGGSAEHEAQHAAHALQNGERINPISTAARGVHLDVGWAQRGPLPDPYGTLFLLNSFAKKFLDAARLIFRNPIAMKLVDEAEAAGVTFGGYSEDGPMHNVSRAYTSGTTVYVPKIRTDPVVAMSDFLFELNNALRAPRFAELHKEAAKGSTGTLTAKEYARRMTALEVEGMLRLGEVWFQTKKQEGRAGQPAPQDAEFFLGDYEAVRSGKKTENQLIDEVLKRVHSAPGMQGKTHEQYYIDAYASVSGGK